ncbi:excisionase [Zobellella sp. DQSA1]|uniref:excisionase n=1 Tax=Zobellella sp. DQSA1 TaxID=3342386 RepID=UPI0035C0B3CF
MHIPIKEWARRHFQLNVSSTTLSTYAKSGQISPAPIKFGGKWMVDENARFVGICPAPTSTDPLVARILEHGKKKGAQH